MTVDWANEDYVRIYTRETADDLDLSWESLALWRAMLTRFDRSGLIAVKNGWASISKLTRIPLSVVQLAGPELVQDGRVVQVASGFLAPNFTEAQTASKSDKARQREVRDRRRREAASQPGATPSVGHAESRGVTDESRKVTLSVAYSPDTDTDTDAEATRFPPDGPAVKKRAAAKAAIADGWSPAASVATEAAEESARQRGVDLIVELEKLRDWAKGTNARKADWDATWRNWTRNAKPSGPQHTNQRPSARSQLDLQAERVRMLEEQEQAGAM